MMYLRAHSNGDAHADAGDVLSVLCWRILPSGLKLMQDADAIVAYSREQIAAHGLEVEEVRDAVVKYLFGDQILPIDPALHPKP